MQERSRNVKTILQGRFRRCIMGIYGKAEESPRSSPRAQRGQEGRQSPVEGCVSGRASENCPQGCPGAVEEEALRPYGALQMTLPALLVKSKAGSPSEKIASAAWAVWFTQCWTQ